jgi:S-formylglutathione hydrolase FrmB
MALVHCHFFSQALGQMTALSALLPEPGPDGGESGEPVRYPTLYLLHGLSDDHTVWLRRTSLERYLEGRRLAVILPAAGRSFYTDALRGQRYGTFISEELPRLARHLFPLSARREENFVAGLSMGGYGAFKLALTHPGRFAAAASLSGALDVARLVSEEEAAGGSELQQIFGPSKPLAHSANDLFHLAAQLVRRPGPRPALYQWCGTEDFLHADNVRFRDRAAALGLALTSEEGPGGHDWACWDAQIRRVLDWLPLPAGR